MHTYTINKEESDRLTILKCLSIIFVVYIHSYAVSINLVDGASHSPLPWWLVSLEDLVSQVITRSAVPMFFLISSILLFKSERNYKRTIFNKAKTLFIPYFFWNSFWILVFIILQSFSFTKPFFSENSTPILQNSIPEWLAFFGIGHGLPSPYAYHLWFMRDLMVITLLFPIIGKLASKFPKTMLVVSATLLLSSIGFPFKSALLWICIGACIVCLQIHITIFDDIAMWKLSLLYVLCAFITLTAKHTVIDVLFVFLGIIYWARVSKHIFDSESTRRFFLKLSEWTFIIYVAHEPTLSSLKVLCFKLLPTNPIWLLIEYFILPIIVIAGCILGGSIFKRIMPKLYHISTGAR